MKTSQHKSEGRRRKKSGSAGKPLLNVRWALTITVVSFFTAGSLSFGSNVVLERVTGVAPFLILLFFILLGILFDMVGIASTTATEKEFHSMAARHVRGARQSVQLVRNADKVSSFCNDVVGDISGIISGATSAVILSRLLAGAGGRKEFVLSFVMAGLVSALTIGGKALGKSVAIGHCQKIIFFVGRLMAVFSFTSKRKK